MSTYLKLGLLIVVLSSSALLTPATWAQSAPLELKPNPDVDTRRPLVTLPRERTLILRNMRLYLIGLQKLTEALANDDMKTAIEATRAMGSINLYDLRLKFASMAVIEFHEVAFEVHRDFDRVAADAEKKMDAKLMLMQVSSIMKKCTYCHETFRLQDMAH